LTDLLDDGLREATDLISAFFVGISVLDSSTVILASTDSVAEGLSQQQNSSHSVALRRK